MPPPPPPVCLYEWNEEVHDSCNVATGACNGCYGCFMYDNTLWGSEGALQCGCVSPGESGPNYDFCTGGRLTLRRAAQKSFTSR